MNFKIPLAFFLCTEMIKVVITLYKSYNKTSLITKEFDSVSDAIQFLEVIGMDVAFDLGNEEIEKINHGVHTERG